MSSLRDDVLKAVPDSARTGILKMALDHQIADPMDPQWAMVGLAWAATQGADLARTALDQVDKAVRGIPERIYAGAIKAGDDLSSALGKEVRDRGVEIGQAITLAITQAASTGAASIRQAADDLPRLASQQQAEIVLEWRAALADAARAEIRQGLLGRLSMRFAGVALALLFAVALGAAGALAAARLSGHLTPWAIRLSAGPTGAPNCGVLRSRDGRAYDVCLTQ